MSISISIQVHYNPENAGQSPVLMTAVVSDKEDVAPVFATGTLGRAEALMMQVIDDAVIRANAETTTTQTEETPLASMPAPSAADVPPGQDPSSQLTLLSF